MEFLRTGFLASLLCAWLSTPQAFANPISTSVQESHTPNSAGNRPNIHLASSHELYLSQGFPSSTPKNPANTKSHKGKTTPKISARINPKLPCDSQESCAQYCLKESYPQFIATFKGNRLYFHDGTSMLWDDGRAKSYEESFKEADLEDQFRFPYPLKGANSEKTQDSSRLRAVEFFKKIYGADKESVRKNLTKVPWLRGLQSDVYLEVTQINDIASRLGRISEALEKLPAPLLEVALAPSGGFYWRKIAGSEILSMHSFGIAIDLNANLSRYWLWDEQRGTKSQRQSRVVPEIVEIFEREGFIWGGRWRHYDTMHFEYRPEILCFAHLWGALEESGKNPIHTEESNATPHH